MPTPPMVGPVELSPLLAVVPVPDPVVIGFPFASVPLVVAPLALPEPVALLSVPAAGVVADPEFEF